jgi:hypothetical protein
MLEITREILNVYRSRTFNSTPDLLLKTREQAVSYVNQRGFIFFWPITGMLLPSLWTAVAGDRPVADAHDDPGHVTWGWKDALLGSRSWYYAKVLRKRATMISFKLLPYFYALTENYGAYEEDYLTIYEQGRLTMEAKQVYEAILDNGRMDTVELRRVTHMSSRSSESRFNRAITDLQTDFKILPVAVTQSGAWRYAFAYDIVARHYPELPDQAHDIQEGKAREVLLGSFARSVGAIRIRDVTRLFGWRPESAAKAAAALEIQGDLVRLTVVAGVEGDWYAVRELVESS